MGGMRCMDRMRFEYADERGSAQRPRRTQRMQECASDAGCRSSKRSRTPLRLGARDPAMLRGR